MQQEFDGRFCGESLFDRGMALGEFLKVRVEMNGNVNHPNRSLFSRFDRSGFHHGDEW